VNPTGSDTDISFYIQNSTHDPYIYMRVFVGGYLLYLIPSVVIPIPYTTVWGSAVGGRVTFLVGRNSMPLQFSIGNRGQWADDGA
jgi:hypothetical protein